jgi:hypothetical protein
MSGMYEATTVKNLKAAYDAIPENAPRYAPRGAALSLFYDRSPEVILDGPAGTGKTRAILEKLHFLANQYPGMRGLIVRRTRASLSQTAIVTFENHVLGRELGTRVKFNSIKQEYRYKNGSRIAIGGLDKAIKIMSAEYDVICIIESTEVPEDIFESLTTRLRNGIVPFQQIIGDCNPVEPSHWLRKRAERGTLKMYASKHRDNPVLFDPITGEITEKGKAYISKLEALTGVRRARLYEGLWVQAEGAIYTDWSREENLVDFFVPPATWARYWSFDFGYTNPFVWQEWARSPDDELYRCREIYYTGRLVEDLARTIKAATAGSPRPVVVVTDHDAEDRATLERHLEIYTKPAYKAVSPGIQAVQARMRRRGNGRRGLYLMRDALISPGDGLPARDETLDERKKPCSTEEEVEGYIWDLRQGRKKGEQPLKENDHGLDSTRYLVAEVDDLENTQGKAELAGFSVLDL